MRRDFVAVFGGLALASALLFGCGPAAPCSRQALGKLELECAARIKLQCAKGDRLCPAYVECSKRIENWRVCPSGK